MPAQVRLRPRALEPKISGKVYFLLIFPTICFFIIVGLLIALARDAIRRVRRQELRFTGRDRLLDAAELELFQTLTGMVPDRYAVCPKVCLWDAIEFQNLDRLNHASEIEQIQSSRLDFVVMEAATSKIVMAVELIREGDRERELPERQRMVAEALKAAEIGHLRVSEWSPSATSRLQSEVGAFFEEIAA